MPSYDDGCIQVEWKINDSYYGDVFEIGNFYASPYQLMLGVNKYEYYCPLNNEVYRSAYSKSLKKVLI